MSLHDDLVAACGLPELMHEHGDPITYTPAGGDGVELTGFLGSEEIVEEPRSEGRRRMRKRPVTITTDPASPYGGVAVPAENAKVSIDSLEWSIREIRLISGGMATLELARPESVERSRPGYRSQT